MYAVSQSCRSHKAFFRFNVLYSPGGGYTFEGACCLHLQGKTKVRPSETFVTTDQTTRVDKPEDRNVLTCGDFSYSETCNCELLASLLLSDDVMVEAVRVGHVQDFYLVATRAADLSRPHSIPAP